MFDMVELSHPMRISHCADEDCDNQALKAPDTHSENITVPMLGKGEISLLLLLDFNFGRKKSTRIRAEFPSLKIYGGNLGG